MDMDQIKRVHTLAQMDRDAVGVYDHVLKHVKDEDQTSHYIEFRDEHAHHASKLLEAIGRLGGSDAELKIDAMGVVAEWVMEFRSILSAKGPLHALRWAESYHNSKYKEAASWDVGDADLASQLRTFYSEEQRHLSYIEEKLAVHT